MSRKDPRVDAYIKEAAPFAQPILRRLREMVHAGCPDLAESIKWGAPHFEHHGMMCAMAAFKNHCALRFWKASLVFADDKESGRAEGMGPFREIKSLADLPPEKELLRYVRKAAELNERGAKAPAQVKPDVIVPDYFADALRNNKRAQATFATLSPSCRREYVTWITEAKRDATREQRIATSLEWLAEGKKRDWQTRAKYSR